MDNKMREAQELLQEIERGVIEFRQGRDAAWQNFSKLMPWITGVYQWMVQIANSGVELPVEVLLQQLENVESAYVKKDMVLMADTLEYEVREGVCFYIEILKCME